MLKSLLIKDIRLLSNYLFIGALLTVLSYVMSFSITWTLPDEQYNPSAIARTALSLSGGGVIGLWFGMFACALVAGNSFTAERADRSALFLDYLPPTRKQVLCSKVIVVACFTTLVFLIATTTVTLAWWLTRYASVPEHSLMEYSLVLRVCRILCCVTGVSFAVSSIAKSNGAPILLGLFSPLIVLSAIKGVDYLIDLPVKGETLFPRLSNACLVVGVASMIMGCWWFVRQRYEN